MGRALTGNQDPTPVVGLRDKVGGFLKGTLLAGPREVKLKRGKGIVYELGILDTDLPITLKNPKTGEYDEHTVNLNDKVSIFAPTMLARALGNAKIGEIVQITYKGLVTGKSGTDYHDFDAEVCDE